MTPTLDYGPRPRRRFGRALWRARWPLLLAAVLVAAVLAPAAYRRLDDWRWQRRLDHWAAMQERVETVWFALHTDKIRENGAKKWGELVVALERPARERAAALRHDHPALTRHVDQTFWAAGSAARQLQWHYRQSDDAEPLPPLMDAAAVAAFLRPFLADPAGQEARAREVQDDLLVHAAPADAAVLRRMRTNWFAAGPRVRRLYVHAADAALEAHPAEALAIFERALTVDLAPWSGGMPDNVLYPHDAAKNALKRMLDEPWARDHPAVARLFLRQIASGDELFTAAGVLQNHLAGGGGASPAPAADVVRAVVDGIETGGHRSVLLRLALALPDREAVRPHLPELRRHAAAAGDRRLIAELDVRQAAGGR